MSSPFIPLAMRSASSPFLPPQDSGGLLGSGTWGVNADYASIPNVAGTSPLVSAPGQISPLTLSSSGVPAPAAAGGGGLLGSFKGWLGDTGFIGSTDANGVKTEGWGGTAVGLGQGILNAFMGMKQYGLAKEQLAEGKRQFDQNYAAQRTTTNTALEDRQRARVASNAGAYESVGSYMARNGVK